jgi:hypothetical protein
MMARMESLALSFFGGLSQLLVIALLGDVRKSDSVQAFIGGATLNGRRQRRRQSSCRISKKTITYLSTSTGDNDNFSSSSVGPKADSANRIRRSSDRRQPRESSSSSAATATSTSTGPRDSPRPDRMARRRRAAAASTATMKGEEKLKQQQQPFDGKKLSAVQTSNLDAPRFDLRSAMSSSSSNNNNNNNNNLHCVTPGIRCYSENENENQHKYRVVSSFEYISLDDLFLGGDDDDGDDDDSNNKKFSLSKIFNSDEKFRNDLRSAIRLDVFETTPFYANLPEKASSVLLLPDSSLEGSWRIPTTADSPSSRIPRMKHTTRVLKEAFQQHTEEYGDGGTSSSSSRINFDGDDLFRRIGEICGNGASTHWIDIYGVQNKKINHSWHLDAGKSPNDCRTVLWGFPPENDYHGTGIFSHIIPLDYAYDDIVNMNDDDNDTSTRHRMEPILYEGTVDEKYIVRPSYEPGKELLIYRDVDVLHSAPDVTYRASVMRFM